jgi:hypothetical protein
MPALDALKAAKSRADLAELLKFKPSALSFILFKLRSAAKYQTFDIAKRNGGFRTIKAPRQGLKLLQRRLSDLLQDCVDEINEATKRKDRSAHGFKRRKSIVTNARRHRHRPPDGIVTGGGFSTSIWRSSSRPSTSGGSWGSSLRTTTSLCTRTWPRRSPRSHATKAPFLRAAHAHPSSLI